MLREAALDGVHKITSVVIPANSDDNAMPATSIRSTERPVPVRDNAATTIVVANDAPRATAEYAAAGTPAAIATAIASAAPALAPVRYGSTSGFPSKSCINVPAIASAAPTSAAMTTRGKRKDHSTIDASSLGRG